MKIQDIFKGRKDEINLRLKPTIKGESFTKENNLTVVIKYSQNTYWLISGQERIWSKRNARTSFRCCFPFLLLGISPKY